MESIEPNVAALCWFALFAGVASLGFYVIAGLFPLETRPDLARSASGLTLVAALTVAFLTLAVGAGLYGAQNLRWTSVVIVGGLALLFAPGLFNLWPAEARDGRAGLSGLLAVTLAAIFGLQAVGGVFLA
ncbi:hypothetical protein IHQ68_02125 [Chelatococcus sambhunathii]|uniref:Major facilitator superfamily (MFS) profile domain-containing protein n=1 Tax=Chelatococcus sambhunathii TaxID=363953 RepID=A0ABU1DBK8_9HYPH|nr:hypothetical protein [Chelatococcus sambhunathii]MDR4305419.1 hypothetical protein [Chelatococcus sambhunathii]